MAKEVSAWRTAALPEPPGQMQPAPEKLALSRTKRLLRLRGIFLGAACFLTVAPFSIRFNDLTATWVFEGAAPSVLASIGPLALVCWGVFLYLHRRLRATGI